MSREVVRPEIRTITGTYPSTRVTRLSLPFNKYNDAVRQMIFHHVLQFGPLTRSILILRLSGRTPK